jgi:hypothetical protein
MLATFYKRRFLNRDLLQANSTKSKIHRSRLADTPNFLQISARLDRKATQLRLNQMKSEKLENSTDEKSMKTRGSSSRT